jgi:AraC-like DNA-binding protein
LLEPGALVVGLAGDRYACAHDNGGGDRARVFQFAPGALETALEPALKAGRVLAPDPRLAAWAARAGRSTDAETLEMAAFALAGAALEARLEAPPSLRAGDRDRAHAAARHLERHHAEPVSLATLAAEVGLSPFHLTRLFRQELGLTPHQYLLRTRLRRAAALLADTATPVTEVAYAVGFGDLSNFQRTFRRHMGETPGAFRRA